VTSRALVAVGAFVIALALTGCGSGGGSPPARPTSSATAPPAATAALAGAPTCPTMAQADAALGVSDTGPASIRTKGNGIVCKYTGAGGVAIATIFAHETTAVFAGQVANGGRAPGLHRISGVGDVAFALSAGGRSIVNAFADGSRTFVAAQAPGALPPVEALARIALTDNG
jgi:hypothetical protein